MDPRLGKKLVRGLTAFVLLSVLGLAFLFALPHDVALGSAAPHVALGFVLLAILGTVVDLPLGAARHQLFLSRLAPEATIWLPVRAELAGRFSGAVTPSQSGGGPAQLLVFHQGGVPVPEALSFLAINFMTNILFFLVGGCVAATLLVDHLPPGVGAALVGWGFVSFLAAVGVMGVLILRPRWMACLLEALVARGAKGRAWARVVRAASSLLGIVDRYAGSCQRFVHRDPGLIGWSLALSAAVNLNRATVGWLLVRALGIPAHWGSTVALLVLLQFALYLVPTPGGSGVAELGTGALMTLVLPTGLLGPFTLGYRFLVLYLPAAVGGVVLASALRRIGGGDPTVVDTVPVSPGAHHRQRHRLP